MHKRKNLQFFSELEPLSKKSKYYGNPFGNTPCNSLKRKLSWKDISFDNLLKGIKRIEHNDKMNKICESMKYTNLKENNNNNNNSEIKSEFYFLYHF